MFIQFMYVVTEEEKKNRKIFGENTLVACLRKVCSLSEFN